MLREAAEVVVPELLVMREPVTYRSELLGCESVPSLPAVSLLGNEADIEEDTQVLRNRRATHLEFRRDRVHRTITFREHIEHSPARRMADRSEDLILALHHHQVTIRKTMLTRQSQTRKQKDLNDLWLLKG